MDGEEMNTLSSILTGRKSGIKLRPSFYERNDVIQIARELLGMHLITMKDGIKSGGIITETEAYKGVTDRASHAFGGRRTARTEIMYSSGGSAYVYLCYGIHSLFNIVTNKKDVPHAVLVRALYPTDGVEEMQARRKSSASLDKLCSGPGMVSQALGIHYSDSGKKLDENEIWIEDRGLRLPAHFIKRGPRIGVDYAGKDALLAYRFRIPHTTLRKLLYGLASA